ncbi:hypothetical protein TCDM_12773 [Trypanosoma cruzi Dm28c]|uniref:Secreted protein n=1 Tax=Trypanosoma cruzi Dm28c TaxID=1416333 RepID=V5A4Q0_TRYCR|nr:hypothetical protein TCDM_12773 [Trypanosoma cruzi Dm28c]
MYVRPSTYSAPSFLLRCFVFLQAHTTTHTQDAHCSGFECSFCGACWQLRVAAVVFFRVHEEEKGREGAQPESLFLRVWCTACDCVELGSVSH